MRSTNYDALLNSLRALINELNGQANQHDEKRYRDVKLQAHELLIYLEQQLYSTGYDKIYQGHCPVCGGVLEQKGVSYGVGGKPLLLKTCKICGSEFKIARRQPRKDLSGE